MRLISWDGMRDVSYENCHLVINPKTFEIEAITENTDFEPVMGIYSTKAKALKVMEMLRETYLSRMELDGGYDRVNNCYVQPNYWVLPKVFKFPDDSEVEVQE